MAMMTTTKVCLHAVPVRTASEQPYRLQDFQLRIFNASEIRQPSPEVDYFSVFRLVKCKHFSLCNFESGEEEDEEEASCFPVEELGAFSDWDWDWTFEKTLKS